MERRLAAILATDVVGYSRLIRADEEGTLAALKTLRADIINPKLAEHHGRIVKLMGDGMLAEFPSVVDAVRAAVETQIAVAEYNADLPEDKRIEFRVGINLGDVVIDGDDIHGDGVNVAARLEGLAEPGGICISGKVYEEIRDRTDFAFNDLGEREVKNINRPVRIWQWIANAELTASISAISDEPLPLPDKPSIVVLPFNNMSGDPEQEFLADGLAEDITTALSRHRWMFVIARNSAFTYKSQAVDISQISRDLGVRYVLEGSVRRSGDRIRATAQLIDAETQNHVWAERFDRMMIDVFDLQDDIAASIIGAIEPNLLIAERDRLDRDHPNNLNAWECIVRSMPKIWNWTADTHTAAVELLRQALHFDSNYARAYSLLACEYAVDVWRGSAGNPDESICLAETYARRAIELDATDPWAHLAIGLVQGIRRQSMDALSSLDTAIKFNPNFALAHAMRGIVLAWAGHVEEALAGFDLAERLSPYDPFNGTIPSLRAIALYIGGQYEEAVEAARESARLDLNSAGYQRILAASCAMAGYSDGARAAMSRLRQLQPSISAEWMRNNMPIAIKEHLELYIEGLIKAGLPE